MKAKILLSAVITAITFIGTAQTAGVLYNYLDLSKDKIKKELSDLTMVRDWGEGASMDMEEPGPNMLKFRFTDKDVCDAINFMSFSPKPERVQENLDAIEADGWVLKNQWNASNFENYLFEKDGKVLRFKNSRDQVFELGYPTSSASWPEPPSEEGTTEKVEEEIELNSAEDNERIISRYGGIVFQVTKVEGDMIEAKINAGAPNFKIGSQGTASDVSVSEKYISSLWVGDLEVTSVNTEGISFKILKQMEMKINGEVVEMFKLNEEYHFKVE